MNAGPEQPPSRGVRWLIALMSLAVGVPAMLAAFDVGPLRASDINGPPWLGFVAGAIFALGGLGVLAGEKARDHPLSWLAAIGVIAGFAAIANWIAFGIGTRQCSVGFSSFVFTSTRAAAEIECRIAFGIGAGLMDGILVLVIGSALGKLLPGSRFARFVERGGQALVLIALLPILVPVFLFLIGKSLIEATREYYETGKWPRNEAFIARMKAKRKPR